MSGNLTSMAEAQTTLDHPQRVALANELHARPFLRLSGSVALAHFAIYSENDAAVHEHLLLTLCDGLGIAPPDSGSTHFSARWDDGRQLKWERHTEFSTYTFVAKRQDPALFSDLATAHVPQPWLDAIAGKRFVAIRMELVSGDAWVDVRRRVNEWIDGPVIVGSRVLGSGTVFCDWTIKPDGFSRFLVIDEGFREAQGGRLLQRLYEIETYRMMALLALPMARNLGRSLEGLQASLDNLMQRMDVHAAPEKIAQDAQDAELLRELTHLAVRAQGFANSGHRFGACRAYERLVLARIQELREERIEGLPTVEEFMERRFTPAMDTCKAMEGRHHEFSSRVARAVDLLRTRVTLAQEDNTTRLLEGMNRTSQSQLHLQHAVEGLSVAAISYYVLSLTGVGLKSLHEMHLPINADLLKGLLIVPVVFMVLRIVRRNKVADRGH